jgi:hypothetical protein
MDSRITCITIVIIVTMAGCTNSHNSTVDLSMYDLSLDSLNHIFFPGSGGRPATATEDHQWRWAVKTMTDEPENNWQSRYGMPYQRNFTITDLVKFRPEEELGDTGEHFIPIGKIDAATTRLWGNTYLHEYQVINV